MIPASASEKSLADVFRLDGPNRKLGLLHFDGKRLIRRFAPQPLPGQCPTPGGPHRHCRLAPERSRHPWIAGMSYLFVSQPSGAAADVPPLRALAWVLTRGICPLRHLRLHWSRIIPRTQIARRLSTLPCSQCNSESRAYRPTLNRSFNASVPSTAIQELGDCMVPVQPELADFLDRDFAGVWLQISVMLVIRPIYFRGDGASLEFAERWVYMLKPTESR